MKRRNILDRELLSEIYGSPSLGEILHHLCDRIGPRFAGSKEESKAAKYVADQFRSFRMDGVRTERFSLTAWERGAPASLAITSPLRREFPVTTLPFSPATGRKGVSGTLALLWDGTPEEFKSAGKALKGRFLLTREGVPPSYPRTVHSTTHSSCAALPSEAPSASPSARSVP
jgi:hypothetical protein